MQQSQKLLEKLMQRGRDFLGVESPILGGAMSWISESRLVSAISNSGGFGVIAGGNMPEQLFKDEIAKTQDLTDKPFGVNLISIAPNFRKHLDYALHIEFPYIIFAGGLPPRNAITQVKQTGSKLLCFAPTAGIARKLIKLGVDALIIEGHEAGGHIGPVSTAVLAENILPKTREVPVFVAGGIGSGLLMLHYLLLGAAGVQLGTRFSVAEESPAHENFKNALIKASAKDAVPTAQFDPRVPVIPVRAITNEGTQDFNTLQLGLLAQLERGAITPKEAGQKLEEFWIGGLRKAAIDGDVESGSLMAGQSVGMVDRVMSCQEIIDELLTQCSQEAARVLEMLTVE
jgi:enoyl-[acyl-carrier protein] reductase II